MVYFKRDGERKKRKEGDREKIQKVDGFVNMSYYAVRRRGKNEIEGWASFFSLSLSQSFFKLRPMSFSFLNLGALFYKIFFFNFLEASSNSLPRFKAKPAMLKHLRVLGRHRTGATIASYAFSFLASTFISILEDVKII